MGVTNVKPVGLILVTLLGLSTTALAQLVNYEMVAVGDRGNAADPTGYGAVGYEYRIGKYEVTIGQYAAFLNAVAKTDTYSLYNPSMATDLNIAGISRSGSSGSYTYGVIAPSGTTPVGADSAGNRPITYASWWDSARFANWMSNGQPTGAQGPATTENGAYALNGATSGTAPAINEANPNTGATPLYRIPTESEWYKAAYYRGVSTYWQYPDSTSFYPNIVGPPPSGNFYKWTRSTMSPDLINDITYGIGFTRKLGANEELFPNNQNFLTNVGFGALSYYKTFDQGGNVNEWNDLAGDSGLTRGFRGGSFFDGFQRTPYGPPVESGLLSAVDRSLVTPSYEASSVGFRLAAPVPEPSTYCMALAGLTCSSFWMWRRCKRS